MGRRRRGRAWPRGGSRPAALVAFGGEERTGREEGRREKRLVGREGKGTCVILALPYVLHLNASNTYIKGWREYKYSLFEIFTDPLFFSNLTCIV
jgi:hypothetical protein